MFSKKSAAKKRFPPPRRNNMTDFQRLTPERVDEFLYFFDNDAFPEGDEWANCYCLEGHLAGEKDITDPSLRREHAKKLVLAGKLTGYLLKDGDRVVGWVKAGDKCDFVDPDEMYGLFSGEKRYGEIKSLYCIDLIPEYRGKGIAPKILKKVIDDAKTEGYKYVEVYPSSDPKEKRNYRGHAGMYHDFGFKTVRREDGFLIMRKSLQLLK